VVKKQEFIGKCRKNTWVKKLAKVKTHRNQKINTEQFLNSFILVLICIPLLVSPFFRGLYFEGEFLPIAIYIALVFAIYLFLYGKNLSLFSKPLDWAIIALLLAYLISTINAAYLRDALLGAVKIATYFLLYILVSRSVNSEKNKQIILNTIFVTGVLVALTGISSQLGIYEFFGAYVGGRIHTSLQYPNSAAAYLTAIYLIGIYLWNLENKSYINWLYGAGNLLIAYTLIGTQSRGGFLVIVAVLFLCIIIYKSDRLRMLTKFLLTFMIALICYALSSQLSAVLTLGVILFGMVCLNGIIEVFSKISIKNKGFNVKTIGLISLIFIFLLGGVIYYINYSINVTSEVNLLKNSEFINGKQIHWSDNGSGGDKREIVKKDGLYWMNLTKGDKESGYWGISQLAKEFKPNTSYTISFDAFSNSEDSQLQIIVHQVGPDGNNPQISAILDIDGQKRYSYTFKTADVPEKESLRIHLLLPNIAEKQDIYISKIQLEQGETVTAYEKTRYVNEQIAGFINRIKSIDFKERNVLERFYFYEDALKIFKTSPLIGLGSGGWKNVYFQYQNHPYFTKEVHNHYLDVLVSTGFLGFIFWLSIWLLVAISLFKYRRKEENNFNETIILSLITLGTHSLVDFTLSLGAICFLFYGLLGLVKQDNISLPIKLDINNRYFQYSLNYLVLLFIVFFAFSFSAGDNDQIELRLDRGLPIDAGKVEESVKLDRLNANLYVVLAARDYNNFAQSLNIDDLQSAQAYIDKAIKLQPNNPSWYKQKARYQFSEGNFEGAIALSQQATKLAPLQASSYEFEAELLLQIIRGLKERNDSSYEKYYELLLEIPTKAQKAVEVIPEDALNFALSSRPDKSQRIPEIIQEAQTLIEGE